ncbi:YkyB family protein [Peribacillus kribbensis]|uniref:YkyB family protein n=1 Tax=Peribacillus kribbensis TaxID=356658 RepID=UPI000404096D|nr:YkyB family protein [Peribacillus kribbensis]
MDQPSRGIANEPIAVHTLAQAIFVVNKHAKTALKPQSLYYLKQKALNQLIKEGKAKKVGLHFSDNPKNSRQQSDVIVECGEYIFHLPPTREDKTSLPHLGNRLTEKRNPKAQVSLSKARAIIQKYLGIENTEQQNKKDFPKRKRDQWKKKPDCFASSFLGNDLNFYKR